MFRVRDSVWPGAQPVRTMPVGSGRWRTGDRDPVASAALLCDNSTCAKRTFAEQVAGVTTAHARRSPLLRRMLERIALALGGRPGQRLTRRLAVEVSRSTLLRLIRALPLPEPDAASVIGRTNSHSAAATPTHHRKSLSSSEPRCS